MKSCLPRRDFLQTSALGFGAIALSHLLHSQGLAASPPEPGQNPGSPHFRPRARSVIMLMQNGGPSQMDLFDPKPTLTRLDGKVHQERVDTFQKGSEANKLLASPFKFAPQGNSGIEIAEVLPHLGAVADDLCLVRSMYTEHNNHTEGLVMMNTGKIFPGRPALGSWVSYALGTENQNLPAYIVLRDPDGYNTSGTLLWQSGWMPATFRGTEVSTRGTPVLNLQPNRPVDPEARRDDLDLLAELNQTHRRRYPLDTELESRIRNYELAARMQLAAADLLDSAGESPATKTLYGLDSPTTAPYGLRCLMARRLVEAGVRFVQIFPPVKPQFQPWDAHTNTKTENQQICAACDQPSGALIKDLKARGLLDETIVLWTGEFGRLPVSQNGSGRDHNRNAFTAILAGGGFKAGHVHGATDDVGYRAVTDRVSVPDLHATILQQLGLDHKQLTFPYRGRPETLTDPDVTGANPITKLLEKPAQA